MSFELSYPIQEDGINPENSPDIYWLVPLFTPFVKLHENKVNWLEYDEELDRKKNSYK